MAVDCSSSAPCDLLTDSSELSGAKGIYIIQYDTYHISTIFICNSVEAPVETVEDEQ